MKKTFTILAIIASIISILLSILPLYKIAIIPAIAALTFGLTAFYLSKKTGEVKKIIQFTFFLTISALAITTYKSIFNKTEIANTEIIDAKENESEKEAIEELEDLEIDTTEFEDIDIE